MTFDSHGMVDEREIEIMCPNLFYCAFEVLEFINTLALKVFHLSYILGYRRALFSQNIFQPPKL